MSVLSNPHDHFFKETFSRPEVARSFLENYLPDEVVAALDLDTLDLRKGSFVDPELQSHFSDLLYRVGVRDGDDALVYLLMEHKSTPDPETPFQLLRYLVRIWEQDARQETGLRPIVPLVIYHGRGQWQIATDFGDLFPGPEVLRPYWPAFRYDLIDLSTYSDEEIRGAVMTQIGLLMLKHIYDADLGQRLPGLFRLFRRLAEAETALEYLRTVLVYVAAASDRVSNEDLAQATQTALKEPGGDVMPTLVEQWIEQGKQEGLKQGLERGLEQGLEQGLERGMERGIRDSILDLLDVRFGEVPAEMVERLGEIEDPTVLRRLLRQAATVDSLVAFALILAERE